MPHQLGKCTVLVEDGEQNGVKAVGQGAGVPHGQRLVGFAVGLVVGQNGERVGEEAGEDGDAVAGEIGGQNGAVDGNQAADGGKRFGGGEGKTAVFSPLRHNRIKFRRWLWLPVGACPGGCGFWVNAKQPPFNQFGWGVDSG